MVDGAGRGVYYATGNADAKAVLDKWVTWALANTTINADGTYQIPSTLGWTGQPRHLEREQPGRQHRTCT